MQRKEALDMLVARTPSGGEALSPDDVAHLLGFTEKEISMMRIYMQEGFNVSWVYLSDHIIESYLIIEKGKDRFRHFYDRVLLKNYTEGLDYMLVDRHHPLVAMARVGDPLQSPGLANETQVPGNRKKYYIVTGECYRRLLMKAGTEEGIKHIDALNEVKHTYNEYLIEIARRDAIDSRETAHIRRSMTIAAPIEDSFLTLIDPHGEQIQVICRASDGYINATALCKAGGEKKEYKAWKRTYGGLIGKLSSAVQICTADLERYENHGIYGRATWVHPRIAIHISQWISLDFAVQVSGWVQEILVRGEVRLGHETPEVELMRQQIEQMQLVLAEKESQLQRVREEERAKAEAEAKARWQRKQEVLLRIHDKSSRPGFIYMMRTPNREGISKIGLTDCVERRLSEFRTSEPAMYCHRKWQVPDMEMTERAVHVFLEDVRTSKHTEWFYDYPTMEDQLTSFIMNIASMPRAEMVAEARAALEALATLPSIEDEVTRSQRVRRNRRSDSPSPSDDGISASYTDDSGSEAEAPSPPLLRMATVSAPRPVVLAPPTPSTAPKYPWPPSLTRELEREAARAKEQKGIIRYRMGEKIAIMKEIWERRQHIAVDM